MTDKGLGLTTLDLDSLMIVTAEMVPMERDMARGMGDMVLAPQHVLVCSGFASFDGVVDANGHRQEEGEHQ